MTKVPLGDSMSDPISEANVEAKNELDVEANDEPNVEANDESDGWRIEAVLGPEYTESVRTVEAVFDIIEDKRHTSRLVQELQRLIPIPSLKHLKRVCPDGRILIKLAAGTQGDATSVSDNKSSGTSERLSLPPECNKKRSFSEIVEECDSELRDGALSAEQYSSTSKSPLIEQTKEPPSPLVLPPGLDARGLRGRPQRCAVPAAAPLTRAQWAHAQRLWSCNFHPARAVGAALAPGAGVRPARRAALLAALRACYRALGARSAAAAVQPHDGSLVALAVDARDEHPLQHAAMRLVDLVARTQGGGVWTPLPGEEVKVVKDRVSNNRGKGDSSPYLCTGLDVVTTHEPCAMCAMALTHARARSVFFSEDNSNCGVLYSRSPPLHTLPGLNHRIQVFRAYLPKEKR